MLASSVPIAAVDITAWGGADLQSHSNTNLMSYNIPTSRKDFKFDLFVINAENTLSLYKNGVSRVPLSGYRIGLWHWETNRVPDSHCVYANFFHEIWTPSSYVATAIQNAPCFPSDVKVSVLPYAYDSLPFMTDADLPHCHRAGFADLMTNVFASNEEVKAFLSHPEQKKVARASVADFLIEKKGEWVLEESRTIFLSVFDFNSDYNRKNIEEVIGAYKTAFFANDSPYGIKKVGLVLKSMNAKFHAEDFARLLVSITGVPNILIIDGVLPDDTLRQLKSVTDCFISLHRSEGWGLNVIEEMMSGRPVILSSYGGSEAYAKQVYDAAGVPELRIPVRMVNVSRPFGPYTRDMLWAQPDPGAAAFAMRQVQTFPQYYRNISSSVRLKLLDILSPFRTGQQMKHRLDQISYCACIVSNALHHEFCNDPSSRMESIDPRACLEDILGESAMSLA
jgi:glycosyltransferase involved in cell wall biosynthesis